MSGTALLPAEFADLEVFEDWMLDTWRARYEKRLASTIGEMQAFYDALFPRLQQVLDHCDGHPIDDLPDDVRNLMLLVFSLCEASLPVEAWRQPRVPDSGAADIVMAHEPRF